MSQLKRICNFLFHTNVIKTVIFNFKMLPKEQAIRLPIHLYGKVDIKDCKGGKIIFSLECKPHFGSWIIGKGSFFGEHIYNPDYTFVSVLGTLILGEYGEIGNGSTIVVRPNATLVLENRTCIHSKVKIYAAERIRIGRGTRISWESQIFDTNFHYYVDSQNLLHRRKKAVDLGEKCWIGNRVTILNGAQLGNFSIVASNSLVNKDYSTIIGGLFVGFPARCISMGNKRVFDFEKQDIIDKWFNEHQDIYQINSNNFI